MNYGPIVFLGVFVTLVTSWFGMIFVPQTQLGALKPVPAEVSGGLYPAAKAGMAQQGAEVYRQQGCYYCHSQQVRQSGVQFDVFLNGWGEKTNAVMEIVRRGNPDLREAELQKLPAQILHGTDYEQMRKVTEKLTEAGGKFEMHVVALGGDLDRGWGARRTVANDLLFERVVMLGEQRIGPDLTSVGLRQPDASWHLKHLYAPSAMVEGSKMPSYTYLFEERLAGSKPSPDALKLPESVIKSGYEVVPKAEARALVAYLLSLKYNAPVFEAPMKPEPKKEEPPTNAVNTATAPVQ